MYSILSDKIGKGEGLCIKSCIHKQKNMTHVKFLVIKMDNIAVFIINK